MLYLRIVEPWVDIFVDVPILGPQLGAVVGPSLAWELTVEDQDVPLLLLLILISVKEQIEWRGDENKSTLCGNESK